MITDIVRIPKLHILKLLPRSLNLGVILSGRKMLLLLLCEAL